MEREQGVKITRMDAYDACSKIREKHLDKMTNPFYLYKSSRIEGEVYIPISKPVSPLPDLKTHYPDEYYDIPKFFDPIEEE